MVIQQNLLNTPLGNQSIEQSALNGGGAVNKQNVSNFMNGLNQAKVSNTNQFMQGTPTQASSSQPLLQNVPAAAQPTTAANTLSTAPITAATAPVVNQNLLSNPGSATAGTTAQTQPLAPITPTTANSIGNNTINPNYAGMPGSIGGGGFHVPGVDANGNPNQSGILVPGSTTYGTIANTGSFDPSAGLYAGNYLSKEPPVNQFINQDPLMGAGAGVTVGTAPIQTGTNVPPGIVSDENLKTNVQDASPNIMDFLNKINAHQYEYKDKGDGVGTFHSPMAQELEKTELGKQAVIETPRGKMVNYGRLTAVNLAAVSVVHREQQKLQKQVEQLRNEMYKGRK